MQAEPGAKIEKGELVTIQTGNDIITSGLWAVVTIASNLTMRHIVLPATVATVSFGETSRDHGITFHLLEPTTEPTGEVFSSLSLAGHQTVQGMHEL